MITQGIEAGKAAADWLPDWRIAQAYAYTAGLDGAGWAWEFLRRNTVYQAEWAAFRGTWTELEAAYGEPPNRDFNAWKEDPRAYVRVSDGNPGDCLVDQDRVLIECALGARWGFHKFPPDPADQDAVAGGRLTWRPRSGSITLVDDPYSGFLGADASRVALGFDLAGDLREQLELAKRKLQVLQRQRVRQGQLQPRRVALLRERWCLLLKLLDARAAGVGEQELTAALFAGDARAMAGALVEAHGLCDGGYLELPAFK
ncbi:MAG: DUF6499 domain-containing protein [Pseudomonadota bacterium]